MKLARLILVLCLASPLAATAADDEDRAFGHVLTLFQSFLRAANSDDPQHGVDELLAGRNADANLAAAGLLHELTADMSVAERTQIASIASDVMAIARKGGSATTASPDAALQARKDLTAMGLRYYDAKEFLDAVGRDDSLAVELFIAGRGVNLSARDWRGRSAFDIARANGDERLAALLSKSRP